MENLKVSTDPEVSISSYQIDDAEVVWFKLIIKVDGREWNVAHRYNEFDELHSKLRKTHNNQGHEFDVKLPPKKFRPKADFLDKRKDELQIYLRELLQFYHRNIPIKLADFLLFYKYQPNGLVLQLYEFLKKNNQLKLTSLHLNALHQVYNSQSDENYQNVIGILKNMKSVHIYGTKLSYLEPSNITREMLCFDLSIFEVCEEVTIKHCCSSQILGLHTLKGTLKVLEINGVVSNIQSLFNPSKQEIIENQVPWAALSRLNINNAKIKKIDDSINLLPNLENLNLAGNELSDGINLDKLLRLTILDLSKNKIEAIDNLYVGNISILNLASNKISSLAKLSRLLGLVSLNLSLNEINEIDEVCALNRLPMLQSLDLTGNSITHLPDYRSQILGRIPNRINDIVLDCVIPDAEEISMGRVISALRQAQITEKEKAPFLGRNFNLKSDRIL